MSAVEEVLNRLSEARSPVVYDAETSGLDWRRNHIVGHVFTFGPGPQDTYYIPVRHAGGGNYDGSSGPQTTTGWDGMIHGVEAALMRHLDQPGRLVVGHNLAFDLKFMWRVGFRMKHARFEDTIINAPLLNEHQDKFSLDYCCSVERVQAKLTSEITAHLVSKFPELTKLKKGHMGHFWRLAGDDPVAVDYATGDGTSTWQLWDKQQTGLDFQNLRRVHDIESRLIPILARMTIRGIRVDEERLHEVRDILDRKIEELLGKFPLDFNPKSPTSVRKWCEQHGVTDWPLTALGTPSFPEAWLKTNEPGQAVVDVRKYMTLRSSFVVPMIENHLWNGRVHAEYNQLRGDQYGTVTGRLSSSNPNLQQVPKRDKQLGRMFRSIFVPDEGKQWGSVDYQQAEPRLLALYSRCQVLLDGYNADPPMDAHTAVAEATGLDRETGKRINQTLLTGGGKGALIRRYGMTQEFVDQVWNDYFDRMPEIKELQRRAAYRFRINGYVTSLLGRRARLNDYNKDYTAVNRLLQCGNADIIKLKMVEVSDYIQEQGVDVDLLNNVHDAIDYQFSPDAEGHYRRCLEIMVDFGPGQVIQCDVPMAVDAGLGRNWGEATYGPEKE